eukprot:2234772-Rhodomonas_salina.2
MSGIDIQRATRSGCSERATRTVISATSLRDCYPMSGTDVAEAATAPRHCPTPYKPCSTERDCAVPESERGRLETVIREREGALVGLRREKDAAAEHWYTALSSY